MTNSYRSILGFIFPVLLLVLLAATPVLAQQPTVNEAWQQKVERLLSVLEEAGQPLPEFVKEAEALTKFAVFTRYPGAATPVTREQYEEALETAERVVDWAEARLY